ncbi:glycoside hydrolase family 88 protein [Aureibaculum sp. A20]|uniref:Glycoside hydrolase family 88 protein n=1 Tax=Aureibaculum flavum TaxID=2795986 RepID=A0ABS0WVR0_9FLAO|nr:glycoside hydrolase family 88 protein [Aureibaculum flavum]MBJ2176067.1 glycoside hydrolase family 88 protein [Aureibaculum flavum]
MRLKIIIIVVAIIHVFNCELSAQLDVVKTRLQKNNGQHSESFKSFTFNGSWCWFSDPRAVYYEGKYKRTYSGWIDNYGNITVGWYDHDTKKVATHIVKKNLEIDDHDNPSILFDDEGKLLVFFNRHGYGDSPTAPPLFLIKSKFSEDISEWNDINYLHLNDKENNPTGKLSMSHDYTNPIRLKSEKGKIYLFWRGIDGKPSFSHSDDNGDTWAKGKILLMPEPIYRFRRPYTKIYSNGDRKIHFTFTDGHPRNEKNNSIYYTYYENGAFYKANGVKIKDIADLPLKPEELDIVYNAKEGGAKAWNWDIAEDKKGNPVIAYAKFPTDSAHYYCYAKWTGKKWVNRTLIKSGKWFQRTAENTLEREPNYSGGISIDHENTNELYLSVNRDSVFEIEKWITKNNGKSWNVDFITKGSEKDNIRPFAVRGADKGNPLQVLWMQNTKYPIYSHASWTKTTWEERFHSSIKMGIQSPKITNPLAPDQIVNIMRQTADWQFANPYNLKRIREWHWGAYFIGLQAFYDITKEDRYKQEMINVGEHVEYRLLDDFFYADQLAIAANWAWLYEQDKDPEMIKYSKWAMDAHLATRRAYKADVRFAKNPYFVEWWTWCDALFMAPPSFAQMSKATGEQKYLNYMDKMFWITTDYLYSKEDSLMFRDDRYFEKKSENGKKIFWGRGNGWVMAANARILDVMPADFANRPKYETLYKEMATKLLKLQGDDWLWRVSLLDPEYQDEGEVSGSAFFTYALAWGLNNGLLDQKYKPQIEKAWVALCNNVNANGRLGNVQPEGIDPRKFTPENWHVYGTGAFLLAGSEMYKLASKN